MEELVDSNGHIVTNTEHSSESIRTRTQVSNLAQEFHRVSFLLQRISIIACSQYFNFTSLDFACLSGTNRLNQLSIDADTSSCRDLFQHFFIEVCQINHHLHIIYSRTVIQGDKTYLLTTATGTYPSLYIDHHTEVTTLQQVYDLCSTNCFHFYLVLFKFKKAAFSLCFFQAFPTFGTPYYILSYSKEPMRSMFTSISVR